MHKINDMFELPGGESSLSIYISLSFFDYTQYFFTKLIALSG